MSSTVSLERTSARGRSSWSKVWPVELGVLVAAGTVYGLADGRDVAPVVVASGFVYLAAAALRRRGAAWPAFGVTFVLIGLGKLTDLDPSRWMLAGAAVLVVVSVASGGFRAGWWLPLQTAAMLVLGAVALGAVQADATIGGLLVATGLLAHAGWDLHHLRAVRVVTPSRAEFCCVLDVVLAVAVGAIALT